jgi:hypothetical protein
MMRRISTADPALCAHFPTCLKQAAIAGVIAIAVVAAEGAGRRAEAADIRTLAYWTSCRAAGAVVATVAGAVGVIAAIVALAARGAVTVAVTESTAAAVGIGLAGPYAVGEALHALVV